jgi:hypothetical protein
VPIVGIAWVPGGEQQLLEDEPIEFVRVPEILTASIPEILAGPDG